MTIRPVRILPTLALLAIALVTFATPSPAAANDPLAASGVQGGLVVQIGVDDPAGTAKLRASESYIVQGLDTDPTAVAAARSARSAT